MTSTYNGWTITNSRRGGRLYRLRNAGWIGTKGESVATALTLKALKQKIDFIDANAPAIVDLGERAVAALKPKGTA